MSSHGAALKADVVSAEDRMSFNTACLSVPVALRITITATGAGPWQGSRPWAALRPVHDIGVQTNQLVAEFRRVHGTEAMLFRVAETAPAVGHGDGVPADPLGPDRRPVPRRRLRRRLL